VPLPSLWVAELVVSRIDLGHPVVGVTLDALIPGRDIRMMLAGQTPPGRLDGVGRGVDRDL
jgi:hypothetical protein